MDVESLRDLCFNHSKATSIECVDNGLPDWIISNQVLRNSKTDYFSIGLYAQDESRSLLLLQQHETALVFLVVFNIDGQDNLLLSLRTEPGLIGLTNLSTTIQSTPSNYQRKHGGKKTPFIDLALDPSSAGHVLYEGFHHDWGDYYLNKIKKFLIVRPTSFVEAPEGFCWVTLDTAKQLLLENHLATNDLRVAMTLLPCNSRESGQARTPTFFTPPHLFSLHHLNLSPNIADCRGARFLFFRTETNVREVNSWIQPLLIPSGHLEICLFFCQCPIGKVFVIEKKTQSGLQGFQLWYPAHKGEGKVIRSVKTSAEGGRFWQFEIQIQLIELELTQSQLADLDASCDIDHADESERWISEQNLSLLVAQSLQTSLELRMAWSLVYAAEILPNS